MVLDLIHDVFEVITMSILKPRDKIIKEIKQILALIKVKLVNKQITKIMENLAMVFRERSSGGQNLKKKNI